MTDRDGYSDLLRAVEREYPAGSLSLEEVCTKPWASITFQGYRHKIAFSVAGRDADTRRLGAVRPEMTGHVLTDLRVLSAENGSDFTRICIEALTVVED